LRALLEKCAGVLEQWSGPPVLIHGDFGPTNLIVGTDDTVNVIDWEFGCSARPAIDFGNLLRPPLETSEPFKSGLQRGYEAAGGYLPAEWTRLALLSDVFAWLEFASRPLVHDVVLSDARQRIRRAIDEFAIERA
jgi:aminoglycoside phosphotransferase (APT) family kinase protein